MDEKTIARFWAKVEKTDGCWLWQGGTATGYGSFRWGSASRLAHRISWLLLHGAWPDGCALHRCDTPRCVNPEHLFIGTRTDNMADKMAKGRYVHGQPVIGSKHHAATLTEADIPGIRQAIGRHESFASVARHYGVSKKTIMNVWQGKIWKHVP